MADTDIEDDPIKAAAQQQDEPEGEEPGGEVPAEVGIEALKIQLKNSEEARQDAERRAAQAAHSAKRSDVEVQDTNIQLITSAIDAIKRDNMIGRQQYAAALANGDFDRAAEINDIMSMNNAKLLQLDNGKVALEARVEEAKKAPPPQAPQGDPVEAVASQLSPRSAQWIRAHPETVRNAKTYTKMLGLHNVAVADGLVADSDEYFEYIETNLGYRKPKQEVQQDEDPQAQAAKPMAPRKPSPPSAPPSRGSSNNRVTLSAAQREAASISGVTEEEYARNLVAEKKRRSN